jgi:glycosyltransferase involved in cell wall biosynthesis
LNPDRVEGRSVRAELGLSAEARVLTVVAQLTPWKGQDDAIRALAELGAAAADVTLLLVGSAKFSGAATQYDNVAYEWQLHDLAEGLGVAERVRFLGERSDVPRILAATDLLLLPSWREAFGRIAIEAMAMAVPVAATDEGGPAEIVSPGVDGLLLPVAATRPVGARAGAAAGAKRAAAADGGERAVAGSGLQPRRPRGGDARRLPGPKRLSAAGATSS